MQYKVPQRIDMEDKIIGPFTMKQFVVLLTGGMITYATIKAGNVIAIVFIGVPVTILTLCLTFIKVQDQPFSKFLFSALLYMIKPKRRAWIKDWHLEGISQSVVKPSEKKEVKRESKHIERAQLEELSKILDSRGSIGELKLSTPTPPKKKISI